jgi:hypothetical protein
MPILGEVKTSPEIGYTSGIHQKWIWSACLDCGKERWILYRRNYNKQLRCTSCAHKGVHLSEITKLKISQYNKGIHIGDKSPNWQGGRHKEYNGYILIKLNPSDTYFAMTNSSWYVAEHRLVMAKHLGRLLKRGEVVHHKNGIKDDNRLENLELMSDGNHKLITTLERRIKYLENRVTQLETEIILAKRGENKNV